MKRTFKPTTCASRTISPDCSASSASQLHWLCYTLTGDEELTAKVLDAALEQSLKGADGVFREWMLSWARRLTIKVCVSNAFARRQSNIAQRPYFSQLMTPGLVNSARPGKTC